MSVHSLPEPNCEDLVFPTMTAPRSTSRLANAAVVSAVPLCNSFQEALDMDVGTPFKGIESGTVNRKPLSGALAGGTV